MQFLLQFAFEKANPVKTHPAKPEKMATMKIIPVQNESNPKISKIQERQTKNIFNAPKINPIEENNIM